MNISSVLKTSSPINDKIQFFNGNSASLPTSNRSSEAFNLNKKTFKSDDFQQLHTQEENIKDVEYMQDLKIQNEELKDRLKKNESIIFDLQERLRFLDSALPILYQMFCLARLKSVELYRQNEMESLNQASSKS